MGILLSQKDEQELKELQIKFSLTKNNYYNYQAEKLNVIEIRKDLGKMLFENLDELIDKNTRKLISGETL